MRVAAIYLSIFALAAGVSCQKPAAGQAADAGNAGQNAGQNAAKGEPGGGRRTWTHKELADHLRAKGIDVQVSHHPGYGSGLASSFREKANGDPTDWPSVVVDFFPDARAASEHAASAGDQGFAWGRFAFHAGSKVNGGDLLFAKIKAALP
jgi:hypothetical protein